MKILHLSWGLEPNNGAANIARMIVREQIAAGHEARIASKYSRAELAGCDELWCHCGWYWRIWLAVWRAKRLGKRVKWMPECCYDPLRVAYHGWKKRLVGPIERWALRKVDAIVATCEEEGEWCKAYLGEKCPRIEVTDVKRFFRLDGRKDGSSSSGASAEYSVSLARPSAPSALAPQSAKSELHILYLGRRHPLKGVEYLEKAIKELNVELRIVSDHTGEELEKDWTWADVLCLPTLSDNFGLVVAEALERGKRVITTDGAPAWKGQPGVVYLEGYREGTAACRVKLLAEALRTLSH